eukprot:CAMPEP_0118929604 /NCGR_PEP_ID=MMETSP1169-20130426/6555_1 /TAXON_ID=36882 /ORGANISM="Pyramimonas obovata, Strain CCMP722" /LENGTH=76 /DNA_ID=CAMNT_0006871823 /DNA_START=514 /DNA_END=744 /DNA_ORIENTATION=+
MSVVEPWHHYCAGRGARSSLRSGSSTKTDSAHAAAREAAATTGMAKAGRILLCIASMQSGTSAETQALMQYSRGSS